MNVLIKYPTRARPDLFRARLTEYLRDPITRVLVSADVDDPSMNNVRMRDYLFDLRNRVTVRWGYSANKIAAVNDGLAEEPWDGLCIVCSDDMVPQRPDFASRILEIYNEFWPDGDGVLHLNDGRTGARLNTLPIFDRKYFDRFGYCYSNRYVSLFADDEFQQVSERLGRAIYVNEIVIAHDWIGDFAPDELHRFNDSFYDRDQRVFEQRRAAGFPA